MSKKNKQTKIEKEQVKDDAINTANIIDTNDVPVNETQSEEIINNVEIVEPETGDSSVGKEIEETEKDSSKDNIEVTKTEKPKDKAIAEPKNYKIGEGKTKANTDESKADEVIKRKKAKLVELARWRGSHYNIK